MRYTALAVVIAVLIPAAALAQTPATPAPDPVNQVNQVLSLNPFGLLLKWPNVEFERKIARGTTLGASASHLFDEDISNVAMLIRWYPQQQALEGFYLGARAGAYRFETTTYDFRPGASSYHEQNEVLPGAGLEIGYNWLLGPSHNVAIGLGFGLTRIIGGGDSHDVPPVLPNFRLVNVGIAF